MNILGRTRSEYPVLRPVNQLATRPTRRGTRHGRAHVPQAEPSPGAQTAYPVIRRLDVIPVNLRLLRCRMRLVMPPPTPSRSADAAEWLLGSDLWAEQWVIGWVGAGFSDYARIFHPLGDEEDAPTWSDVAAAHGQQLTEGSTWAGVLDQPEHSGRSYPGEPMIGTLGSVALAPLCEDLGRHTGTPEQCWFAVWDGWGLMQPAPVITSQPADDPALNSRQLDLTAATFEIPGRRYLLYEGAVEQATAIGWWHSGIWFQAQSPSLIWPQDHAWCVATEVDADFTLVGGSSDLIDAILANPHLEAVRIAPYAPRPS